MYSKQIVVPFSNEINCSFIARTTYKTQLTTFNAFDSRKYYNLYDVINNKVYPRTLITFKVPSDSIDIILYSSSPMVI